MMGRYYLGIDNGGTVSKAALFDERGNELATAWRYVEVLTPKDGWSERDATEMWLQTAASVREVIASAGIDSADIACVACTGHGNGLYLIDAEGKPVRNAINSSDERAAAYIRKWQEEGVYEKVLPLTAQSLWAAQPNALLSWLRDHEPYNFEQISAVLMAKDFIRFKLTGEIAAEITDMSATSLMNVPESRYDDRVLALFGLDAIKEMLPPLTESTALCGRVTEEAAGLTGLKAGTKVAAGMFDIDACALSSGIIDSQQLSIVAGTWGNNQYISQEPLIDKELFMTSRYSIPGWYIMLEGSPTSTGNMQWVTHNMFRKERDEMGGAFFDWVASEVASVDPADSSLIFLPFVYGSNCGNVQAGFYGISAKHTSAHLLTALFEGVVFAHYQHFNRLLRFRDKPETIRFTGGAARSDVWCQLFADCMGIPVEVPKGTELGAFGAALAAMVADGCYASLPEAVRDVTSIRRRYEPNPLRHEIYREKYDRYQKLISLLRQFNA